MHRLFGEGKPNWDSFLIVGVGNRIKGDDGVGIYITKELKYKGLSNIIIAENGLENYIGKINSQNPKGIVLVDALDIENEKPGFFELIPVNEIKNTTSGTHNLSFKTLTSFFETNKQWILGIQPENVSYGLELSQDVKTAADEIVNLIVGGYQKYQIDLNTY